MKLWVVGKIGLKNYLEWQFEGVFDDEQKAIAACKDENYFVGPTTLNQEYDTEEAVDWVDAYYPIHKEDIDGNIVDKETCSKVYSTFSEYEEGMLC